METYECCPFKTTPGRLFGGWTNCIHGLMGRRKELQDELKSIEEEIDKRQRELAAERFKDRPCHHGIYHYKAVSGRPTCSLCYHELTDAEWYDYRMDLL